MNAKKPCQHGQFGSYWRVSPGGYEWYAGIVCGKCQRHFDTSTVRRALIAYDKAKKEKRK